jgi:hypothetical protein
LCSRGLADPGSVGLVTTWFERRAGSEETLLALYDAVGAAEELDLEEEAQDEAHWAEIRILHGLDEPDGTGEAADASDDESDEADRVSMAQAVGLIEHLLGGTPMRSGGQSAS